MKDTRTEFAEGKNGPGFLSNHRTLILAAGLILFLPPLALVFQAATGDGGFCGTWCPRMFFVWRAGETGHQYLMGWLRSWMGAGLVLGILASTLLLGRYWCSHLCPIGGACELGSRLMPRFLKIDFSSVPAPPVRYGYLAVYLAAPALGLGSLCCNYCNFFCPIGAMDSLVNRAGAGFGKRVRVLADRCTGCGLCRQVCPTWAVETGKPARIDPYSCVPCRECEKVCPASAIVYGKLPKETAAAGTDSRGLTVSPVAGRRGVQVDQG